MEQETRKLVSRTVAAQILSDNFKDASRSGWATRLRNEEAGLTQATYGFTVVKRENSKFPAYYEDELIEKVKTARATNPYMHTATLSAARISMGRYKPNPFNKNKSGS